MKSKDSFLHMRQEYDNCFKNWKQSGFHANEIPTCVVDMITACVVPFENFSHNSSSMLYFHKFVYQFPGILNKITGNLASNQFSESVGGKAPPKDPKAKRGRGRPVSDPERKMQESFESRNKAIEFTLFCETSASMCKTLRELRTERRKAFSTFASHCGENNIAKARHCKIRKKRKSNEAEISDDSFSDAEDSQESTLVEICDLEDEIKSTMDDLEKVKAKKKAASLLLQDKNSN